MTGGASVHVRGNYAYAGFGRRARPNAYAAFDNSYAQYIANVSNVIVGGSYTFTGFDFISSPTRTRVTIDPNIRVRGNSTYAGFEDVEGPISVDSTVDVYEAESGLVGEGRITEIDSERKLVYLSVDWSSLAASETTSSSSHSSPSPGGAVYFSESMLFAEQEDWMSYLFRPCLAYVSIADMTLSLTGPATLEWNCISSDVSLSSFAPHLEIKQSYAELPKGWVVAA